MTRTRTPLCYASILFSTPASTLRFAFGPATLPSGCT
jgi:hypothetical protein